jgi:cytosine/creatinine deaminase
MMHIRPAAPSDSAEWLRMRSALWPEEQPGEHAAEIERYFAGQLREPLEVLLAVDEAEHAHGFAELSIRAYAEDCETDRVAFLEGWYVDPGMRQQGIGSALVAAAEAWARDRGCTEFASDALIDNEVSARAHEALGFVETARLRCFRKDLTPRLPGGSTATPTRSPDEFMRAAIGEAERGAAEGGIPIGSVVVHRGKILGRGHNRRVQRGSAVLHGEMDALENAGRQKPEVYRESVLYTTLSPCAMCSGAILLYGIPRVVIGENRTFLGEEDLLRSRGVALEVLQDAACIRLMTRFIQDHPRLWNEDIGI